MSIIVEARQRLNTLFTEQGQQATYSRGKIILTQGPPPNGDIVLFRLDEGVVSRTTRKPYVPDVMIDVVRRQGTIFGEEAISGEYFADARAVHESTLTVISSDLVLAEPNASWAWTALFAVADERADRDVRYAMSIRYNVHKRTREALKDLADPKGVVTATGDTLASRTQTTRQSVSGALQRLAKLGVISITGTNQDRKITLNPNRV